MRGWLIGLVLLAAGSVAAQDLPVAPPSPLLGGAIPAAGKTAFAQSLMLGSLKVRLDHGSMLPIIRDTVGVGVIDRIGDGGERLSWLCYTLPHARLWLAAQETDQVYSVTAQASETPPSSHCPVLPAKFRKVSLDGGIWLGMDGAALTRQLGAAGRSVEPWYGWHRTLALKTDGVDEDDNLVVRVDQGKVVFLMASRAADY